MLLVVLIDNCSSSGRQMSHDIRTHNLMIRRNCNVSSRLRRHRREGQ
jgi:hypothetical protein